MYNKNEVEAVKNCYYCNSNNIKVKYENVHDIFNISFKKWKFSECQNCKSLILNPRPKEKYIKRSYQNYYTNYEVNNNFLKKILLRFQNSYFSSVLKINIKPSLYPFNFITNYLQFLFMPKYELKIIKEIKKRNLKIIDYGCGDGKYVEMLNQIGHDAYGIDFNEKILKKKYSNSNGKILIGGIETLINFSSVDIIICSHTIEHVYNPIDLIKKFYGKLNDGGRLLLSCPNSESHVLNNLKEKWRGLEAPMHISIPTKKVIEQHLKKIGFKKVVFYDCFYVTNSETNNPKFMVKILKRVLFYLERKPKIKAKYSDFIQLVAYK